MLNLQYLQRTPWLWETSSVIAAVIHPTSQKKELRIEKLARKQFYHEWLLNFAPMLRH